MDTENWSIETVQLINNTAIDLDMDIQGTEFIHHLKKVYMLRQRKRSSNEQWSPLPKVNLHIQITETTTEQCKRGCPHQGAVNDLYTPILPSELFRMGENKTPVRKVIVEGKAGIGKTTLCTMLTEQWANGEILTQFDCVLLLPFGDQLVASASSLSALLTLYHPDESVCGSVVQQLMRTRGKNVLIIADGWDELSEKNHTQESFFYNLLLGHLLPAACVLLTSRPSASAPFHDLPTVDRLVELVGFNEQSAKQYIEAYFEKCPEKAAMLYAHLESNPLIQSMCHVPRECALICNLWSTLDGKLPETHTELYAQIILNLVFRNDKEKFQRNSFDSIPTDIHTTFWLICKFAFESLLQNRTVFAESELASAFPNHQFSSDKVMCFGLIQCVQSLVPNAKGLSFHFLHLTIQEFLAALQFATLPTTEKVWLCEASAKSNQLAIMWRFVFGLGKDNKYSKKVISLDENMVNRFVDIAENSSKLLLCHCSFELSNTIMTSKVVKKLNGQFESLRGKSIAHTPHDCVAVFHVLRHTASCDNLRISLNKCGLTDKLLNKLTDILSRPMKVKYLSLCDNQLTDDGLNDLFTRASSSLSSREFYWAGNNTIDFKPPCLETYFTKCPSSVRSSRMKSGENLTDDWPQTAHRRAGCVSESSSGGILNSLPACSTFFAQAAITELDNVRSKGPKECLSERICSDDTAQSHSAKSLINIIWALKFLSAECILFNKKADEHVSPNERMMIYKLKIALNFTDKTNNAIQFPLTLQDALAVEHKLLLQGSPGTGKTTVIKHLIYTFQTRYRVLYFDLSWPKAIKLKQSPEDLLLIFGHQYKQLLIELEHDGGANCIVFIDNYTDTPLEPDSIVRKILEEKFLQRSKKVIACRAQYAENISSIIKFDITYSVKGLESDELERLFHSQNEHWETLILPFLKQNDMYHMCTNPLVSSCVLSVLRYQLPKTLTDFVYELTCDLLAHDFSVEEKYSHGHIVLEKLPDSVDTAFDLICQLAMEHLLLGHKCNGIDESWQFLSSFLLQQSADLSQIFRFSLVQLSTDMEPSIRCAYQFIFPQMIEFLAAFYLYKQPPLNQLQFLFKYALSLFKNGFTQWLQFFFGLIGRNYVADHTQYNPTKIMINTVIDVLVFSLELNYDLEYRYNLIMCINELQEKSLFRKLAAKHPVVLSFSVKGKFATCVQPVLSLISNSGLKSWTAKTCTQNKEYVDKLNSSKNSVSIITDNSLGEMVSISLQRSHSEVAKMYRDIDSARQILTSNDKSEKLNQFCCRAVREILQRVFTIYSPVKIKGDASNLSYVSFLTCKCFEDSFNAHVRLYPLQPVHFLSGPKKDMSKVVSERLTKTDSHNLSKHDGESVEVVIMLRPLLQQIEGTVPMTDEKFSLVLSQDLILDINDDVKGDLVVFERCIEKYEPNGTLTEQILPTLPVVQKTIYGRSQTAYPRPFLPPAQEPKPSPTIHLAKTNTLQDESRGRSDSNSVTHNGLQARSKVMAAVHDEQTPSFNPYLQRTHKHSPAQALGTTSIQSSQAVILHHFVEQAASEARVHPRRQTAPTPGTVMFSSIQEIPSDQIQPLPQQHTLMRKGGNGSIFSENVCGLTLAVKRTSYRSKEYAIITTIRHKNIIPLLAYVWGEEHQENRRRHFVYHYLPKLSGDLARLITDKHELCLYEFHKVHQNNLRAMGVAVGNVKYVLTQVLQGLQYLHQTHIAHRDLKASNVLVKFFCGCSNPLECACDVKYQVVLCDFDAAIELDSNDRILPTLSYASRTRDYMGSSPFSHYEIVPVGTNGFRSPESSMHIVANTPEAFSPPLTTKTDIYSFGILCLRLMISTDTPYSQRAMAVLLLHYHQLKGGCEGRIALEFNKLATNTAQVATERTWSNFLQIQEGTVLKIMKLKLMVKMSWLRGGYEFVRQCLSVDPETRPTASNLLTHSFLN